MAYTEIHAITTTWQKAVDYGISDKTGPLRDDIHDGIAYVIADKDTGEVDHVIYKTLSSYQLCTEENVLRTMRYWMDNGRGKLRMEAPRTKNGEEVVMWHCLQSFDDDISPQLANEIGCKLAAEVFDGHAAVISTHTNTDQIHNHIMFCAWDINGRKYHDCHESKRLIRRVSDRLCAEHGLHVMEHTRDMRLIKYTDKNGNLRYYEPTDRKNKIIRQRAAGEKTTDDVNSYRNTHEYEIDQAMKMSNRDIVKKDIDALLPAAESYEHLIDMLRGIGYIVKDKKVNGDWLAHVTYTPPMRDKGTRDYKIGDGQFYVRENLTSHINDLAAARAQTQQRPPASPLPEKHIPYFADYDYDKIDVYDIDDQYRKTQGQDGEFTIVQRGQPEQAIIRAVKQDHTELYQLYDTSTIKQAIAAQAAARRQRRPYRARSGAREEILVQRIQTGLDNLRFMERKQLHSYTQINTIVSTLWDKHDQCKATIKQLDGILQHLAAVLAVPDKAAALQDQIAKRKDDTVYMAVDYAVDKNLLATYQATIAKYQLTDKAAADRLKEKIDDMQSKLAELKHMLTAYAKDLGEYDRCINYLSQLASGRGQFSQYEQMQQARKEDAEKEKQQEKDMER